jgi:hypothetical protein
MFMEIAIAPSLPSLAMEDITGEETGAAPAAPQPPRIILREEQRKQQERPHHRRALGIAAYTASYDQRSSAGVNWQPQSEMKSRRIFV